jgi:hypothetical protein
MELFVVELRHGAVLWRGELDPPPAKGRVARPRA